MKDQGFSQITDADQYVFYKKRMVGVTYIDDCLVFARNKNVINEFVSKLKNKFK